MRIINYFCIIVGRLPRCSVFASTPVWEISTCRHRICCDAARCLSRRRRAEISKGATFLTVGQTSKKCWNVACCVKSFKSIALVSTEAAGTRGVGRGWRDEGDGGVKSPPQLRSSAVFHISCLFVLNCDRSTVKHALQNAQNDCYQWLSNSSRVHQIRFRPGLRSGPRWGAYSAPRIP